MSRRAIRWPTSPAPTLNSSAGGPLPIGYRQAGSVGREQLGNYNSPDGDLLSWNVRRIAWEAAAWFIHVVMEEESKIRPVIGAIRHGVDYTADEIWVNPVVLAWPIFKEKILLLLNHFIREDRFNPEQQARLCRAYLPWADASYTPSAAHLSVLCRETHTQIPGRTAQPKTVTLVAGVRPTLRRVTCK